MNKLNAFIIAAGILCCSRLPLSALSPQEQRTQFIEICKSYLGTPYVYGGTSKRGMDCSGLIFVAAKNLCPKPLPRTAADLYSFSEKIADAEREPGDLVFFKTAGTRISHTGVYLGSGSFIHSASDGLKTGVIISSLSDSYWKKTYAGSGRIFKATGFGDQKFLSGELSAAKKQASAVKKTTAKEKSAQNQNASTAKTQEKENSTLPAFRGGGLFSIDVTASFNWNIQNDFSASAAYGGSCTALLSIGKRPVKPGISAGFRITPWLGIVQIPVCAVLSISPFFSVYTGIVLTAGTPIYETNIRQQLKSPLYPGTFGITVNTPALKISGCNVRISQDISYTLFTDADGGKLTLGSALRTGLVFSTGVRVTIPI
ncbi:MAG: C40 family peptidase [Bacteroides sp.]|nr:C40 family peptidase [Prevotella sp.]MCM1408074.1 C40 family peptidase [Treponema brennaborense]MCM1469050.1 C40 family peptidase [Bacteroides sp.]